MKEPDDFDFDGLAKVGTSGKKESIWSSYVCFVSLLDELWLWTRKNLYVKKELIVNAYINANFHLQEW